ncbi:MAG: LCP family protein [Patescibacteria group bacterium]|nr:LCP family protein [Patescibacteria group bacterium]
MSNEISVDFLETSADRGARKKTMLIAVFFACFVGVLATLGAAASYRAASNGTSVFAEFGRLPGIAEIRQFANTEGPMGANAFGKTPDDRINILFLGVGGENHDGGKLTDTIILSSYDTKENKFAMLSIPRDLAYPIGNSQFRKINTVHAIYEVSNPGEGAEKTAEAFSKLLAVRIDHVVRVDFDGFSKFIDALGGIDVNIERGFTDNSYPTDNHKYQTISFEKGPAHLDGNMALKYVRSRHGTNGEGSDFARSRRQQIVIYAIRDKLLSMGTLANPKKLSELYGVVSDNLQSDLSAWDMIALAPEASKLDKNQITMRVLTDAPDGELVPANVNGAYMLFPRKPDWSEIRAIATNPFITKEQEKQELQPQTEVVLEIKNGTNYEGYAFRVSQQMKNLGYQVPDIGNAKHRGYERSIIYDLTGGALPEELVRLKKLIDADISSATPRDIADSDERSITTEDMATETLTSPKTQFLVILGESSLGLIQPYATPSQ